MDDKGDERQDRAGLAACPVRQHSGSMQHTRRACQDQHLHDLAKGLDAQCLGNFPSNCCVDALGRIWPVLGCQPLFSPGLHMVEVNHGPHHLLHIWQAHAWGLPANCQGLSHLHTERQVVVFDG